MPPALLPADAVPAAALHAAFAQAFADYLIGPFDLPADRWPQFLARQCVDLRLSRVAVDREPLAFALVAPRPAARRWRLATMGALPAARGRGAAPALLDDLLARAAAAGVREVELEVFAQNERAHRLYRGRGFTERHALHGYEADAEVDATDDTPGASPPPDHDPALRAIDLASAFAWLDEAAAQLGDVPLQVTPASLSAVPPGLTAWRRGDAQLVFGEAAPGSVTVHSLLDRQPAQRDAEALVRALRASRPGCRIVVPQLQRLDLGGEALRRAGFRAQPLHQLLMARVV